MPIFRGVCTRHGNSDVYFWIDLEECHIESAQLVLHDQQSDTRGERQLARAISYICGREILGVSTRTRRRLRTDRRHAPYSRVHRTPEADAVPEIEVIDLTESAPGAQEGNQNPSESLLHEGGHSG